MQLCNLQCFSHRISYRQGRLHSHHVVRVAFSGHGVGASIAILRPKGRSHSHKRGRLKEIMRFFKCGFVTLERGHRVAIHTHCKYSLHE